MKRKQLSPVVLPSLAAAFIIVFAAIADELAAGNLRGFDHTLLLSLRDPRDPATPLGPAWLHVAARDVTALGSTAVLTLLAVAALGFLALKRQWDDALLVLVSIGGGTLVSNALKDVVERPRPDFAAEVAETYTYSFPSGHAFLSAVAFLTLGALLARAQRETEIKTYILGAAIALAILVGLSRIYLGMHWPTDVLAGWSAGAAWALLCWLAMRRLR
jgi:undecaprenyl-diphosphatase